MVEKKPEQKTVGESKVRKYMMSNNEGPKTRCPTCGRKIRELMRATTLPVVGDYVLATKYSNGDPCDHFFVGFVTGFTHHGRYLVADAEGKNARANGFRRVKQITSEEGHQLVEMMPKIGDTPGPSVWWHLEKIRELNHDEGAHHKSGAKKGAT